jgi:hypothetical protein
MISRSGYQDAYEIRIVAFLDILGWRALVSESSTNQTLRQLLLQILCRLDEHYQWFTGLPQSTRASAQETELKMHPVREQDGFPRDFQFAQFSDSIILSAKLTRLGVGAFRVFLHIPPNRHIPAFSRLDPSRSSYRNEPAVA